MSPAGGGLFTTISEYAKFAQMLCNGGTYNGERIIGRKTLELMTTDQLTDLEKKTVFRNWHRLIGSYSYGLGMRVMVDPKKVGYNGTVGEFGWTARPALGSVWTRRKNLWQSSFSRAIRRAMNGTNPSWFPQFIPRLSK